MRGKVGRGILGVNFEMAAKKQRSFQQAFQYMSVKFKEEVWSGDTNLEIMSMWVVLKIKRVDEVTKCMSVDRKEKKI